MRKEWMDGVRNVSPMHLVFRSGTTSLVGLNSRSRPEKASPSQALLLRYVFRMTEIMMIRPTQAWNTWMGIPIKTSP